MDKPYERTLPAWAETHLARCRQREKYKRVVCGARRRGDGQPCQALSVPGKRRCKWHGGMSTGPKTRAGKAKAARNLPLSAMRAKRKR
jgi:hypothetical protein